jgi:hypothetical protein
MLNETPQQREQRIRQENMAHMNLGVSVNSVAPRVLPGECVLKEAVGRHAIRGSIARSVNSVDLTDPRYRPQKA